MKLSAHPHNSGRLVTMATGECYDLFHSPEDLEWIQQLNLTSNRFLTPRESSRSPSAAAVSTSSCYCLTNDIGNNFQFSASPWNYLKHWKENEKISSPVLHVFLDLLLSSASSLSSHGGGGGGINASYQSGWLCISLTTAFILSIYSQHSPHQSISHILQGYHLASHWIQQEMRNKDCPIAMRFHWSDHSTILSLISSLLDPVTSSCSLTPSDLNHISSCLLEAFITSLIERDDKFVPNILFYSIPSVSPSCMNHYSGTLILEIPIPPMFPLNLHLRDTFVAVFESSIEIIPHENLKIELDMSRSDHSDLTSITSAKQAEYQMLRSMCEIIVNSKVQLLCCQKRIHPYLQQLLRRKGVICLPRLSILHINKILAISGATQLGAFSNSIKISENRKEVLQLSSLGYVDSLSVDRIGGKKVLVVRSSPLDDLSPDARLSEFLYWDRISSRRSLMSTVTVCGWHENQVKEIQQISETIIGILTHLIQSGDNPMVLPGGGCWLRYLVDFVSQELRNQEEKTSKSGSKKTQSFDRRILSGARSYFQTLEGVIQILDGHHRSMDDSQFQIPLSTAEGVLIFQSPNGRRTVSYSNKSGVMYNESGEEMESGYVLSSNSLDLYEPSYWALQVSLETARCILEIDGVILQSEP